MNPNFPPNDNAGPLTDSSQAHQVKGPDIGSKWEASSSLDISLARAVQTERAIHLCFRSYA
jgi:hypothetical protein